LGNIVNWDLAPPPDAKFGQIWRELHCVRPRRRAKSRCNFNDEEHMAGAVATVVVAGGRGSRAGGQVPKQYRTVGQMPVLRQSLAIFATTRRFAGSNR